MPRKSVYHVIGRRLATLRRNLMLDEKEAARIAGVTARSWRKWESGSPISTKAFLKVGDAYGIHLDWLAGLRGHETPIHFIRQ